MLVPEVDFRTASQTDVAGHIRQLRSIECGAVGASPLWRGHGVSRPLVDALWHLPPPVRVRSEPLIDVWIERFRRELMFWRRGPGFAVVTHYRSDIDQVERDAVRGPDAVLLDRLDAVATPWSSLSTSEKRTVSAWEAKHWVVRIGDLVGFSPRRHRTSKTPTGTRERRDGTEADRYENLPRMSP